MSISLLVLLGLKTAPAAASSFRRRETGRFESKRWLYRKSGLAAMVVLMFAGAVLRTSAQMPELKRPAEENREKPAETKPKKKVKGPRAVGVVQLNEGGKSTLIPVAILVDGKFYDASIYKADPVPMALESGTVYEVEQAGDSQGLFTISGALHSKTPGSPHPWVGAGAYLPNGTEAAKATRKAEDVPVGINDRGDEPPRLTRGTTSKPAANPNSTSTSGTSPGASSAGNGGTARPAATQTGSTSSTGAPSTSQKSEATASSDKAADSGAKDSGGAQSTGQTASEKTQNRPTAPGQQAQDQGNQGQEGTEYYRPTLRRGKPTQSAPQEDEDAGKASKPSGASKAAPASAAGVQVLAAISDAGGPEPKSYKFFWKTGEEDERRNQMLELAGNEVRAYATALGRNQIPAKPTATKAAAAHKAPAKPVQPVFENIHFRGFDVWGNNQPVMVLNAEAHMPASAGSAAAPGSFSVTLVAKTDIYGDLHKLYAGITDKFHLDVTPQLELIDAVDADGDGRGELLFSETTDAGTGYLIYRATADTLWKMFDSLGGE